MKREISCCTDGEMPASKSAAEPPCAGVGSRVGGMPPPWDILVRASCPTRQRLPGPGARSGARARIPAWSSGEVLRFHNYGLPQFYFQPCFAPPSPWQTYDSSLRIFCSRFGACAWMKDPTAHGRHHGHVSARARRALASSAMQAREILSRIRVERITLRAQPHVRPAQQQPRLQDQQQRRRRRRQQQPPPPPQMQPRPARPRLGPNATAWLAAAPQRISATGNSPRPAPPLVAPPPPPTGNHSTAAAYNMLVTGIYARASRLPTAAATVAGAPEAVHGRYPCTVLS